MSNPKSENPFFLVLLTVFLLAAFSLVPGSQSFFGVELKELNLLSDVTRREVPYAAKMAGPATPVKEKKPSAVATALPASVTDTEAVFQPVQDSLLFENLGSLANFYQALFETKASGAKTRIAYFGDSMIEGDLITGDLRNKLQYEFGGEGVGFVPITSVTAEFRNTIRHSFSTNWVGYNLVSKKVPAENPIGISGHVFVPSVLRPNAPDSVEKPQPSWVQFTGSNLYKKLSSFQKMKLFYGPGSDKDKLEFIADKKKEVQPLIGTNHVNELVLQTESPSKKVKLVFDTFSRRNVYGISFESDSGVIVDNFSFRGNSGMSLTKIPQNILSDFNSYQQYNLVILHYGMNVANAKVTDYRFYERGMTKVVNKLKQAFPNASILLVGMSDKGYNNAGEYTTDPSIPLLLQAQQNIARNNDVAFWNLFEAMGGYNSMVSWVEAKPPLANKDYTHLNFNGSRKVADLLYRHLMEGYKQFEVQQPKKLSYALPNPAHTAASERL